MVKSIFIIIIVLVILNACTSTVPSVTSTSVSTDIQQVIPTITVKPTSRPSFTPEPTITPNPTELVFKELKSIFPEMCDSYPWEILMSPDDNWLAQGCQFDSLKVMNRDGATIWKVTYQEIFGKSADYPYNQGGIAPRHWTKDSQYLYFSVDYCCADPGFGMLAETDTLYRLSIKNGTYNLLQSGIFDFSFSPTDRRLIFIQELNSPPIVEINDLQSGNIKTVRLKVDSTYNQAKLDAWSSDGLSFAVKAVSGINYSHKVTNPDMFSLIIVDVNNSSQKFIVKDLQTSFLKVLEWSEDDILIYQTGDDVAEPVAIWQYDLKTDSLNTPTPTP
jgi:hypothetical protein